MWVHVHSINQWEAYRAKQYAYIEVHFNPGDHYVSFTITWCSTFDTSTASRTFYFYNFNRTTVFASAVVIVIVLLATPSDLPGVNETIAPKVSHCGSGEKYLHDKRCRRVAPSYYHSNPPNSSTITLFSHYSLFILILTYPAQQRTTINFFLFWTIISAGGKRRKISFFSLSSPTKSSFKKIYVIAMIITHPIRFRI